MSERVAIIFADMREARPLVRGWERVTSSWLPKRVQSFQKGNTIAVIAGMGAKHAAAAARVVIEEFAPELLVSAGFAGAIDEKLEPSTVLRPMRVVNATTEQVHAVEAHPTAQITIVSADHVVNEEGKRELASRFSAVAVDMEAAAIAEIAHAAGIRVRVVKVISERASFPMPPFDRFLGDDGRFRTASFLIWTAMHPQYWVPLMRLGRDSIAAADELASELAEEFCL
jgi:adenosylhomocysteine nucleosidase